MLDKPEKLNPFLFSYRPLFDPFLVILALKQTVYIYTGCMNMIRIEGACRNQLFHFRNGNFSRHRHQGIEIAGRFPVNQVPLRIAFPGLYNSKYSFPLNTRLSFPSATSVPTPAGVKTAGIP